MTECADISHAPGCFGSAMTFVADAPECRTCIFAIKCAPLSHERRQMMRVRLGLPPEKPALSSVVSVTSTASMARPISKTISAMLERFEKAGINITRDLAARRNPFASSPIFMRITCHVLLNKDDGISRVWLAHAFRRKMQISDNTADVYADRAILVLSALDVIQELNGLYKLKV